MSVNKFNLSRSDLLCPLNALFITPVEIPAPLSLSGSGSATLLNVSRTDTGRAEIRVSANSGFADIVAVRDNGAAISSGTTISRYFARGSVDSSGTLSNQAVGIHISAAETFSSTAQGTIIEFLNVINGTTSNTTCGGAFGAGTGGMFVGNIRQLADLSTTKLQITTAGDTNSTFALKTYNSSNANKFSIASNGQVILDLTTGIPVAANNAAASAAGVPVGGLYRTNADPAVVCVRTI